MPETAIAQAILDEIKGLASRFERVEGRMSGLERRMAALESVVADVDSRVKGWPDMHYLSAAAKMQLTRTQEVKNDLAEARVRIDEIFQAMATNIEIKNLREDVARFRDQSLETEVRLGTIEGVPRNQAS
jgi:phage gp16-like protein